MPYTWKGVTAKSNLATPGDSRVELCWVRLIGRSKDPERLTGLGIEAMIRGYEYADPSKVTDFHILLQADTFVRYLVDHTDEGITLEIHAPDLDAEQSVPLVGPSLRIVNL